MKLFRQNNPLGWFLVLALPVVLISVASLFGATPSNQPNEDKSASKKTELEYPPGKLGEMVRLGEAIVGDTQNHPLSKPYVNNSMNCTSCHLDNGRHPTAGSFIGSATAYPAWSPREERVVTLQDRALNCFMRSQNGIRPPVGSRVSIAVTAYITWLSNDQPIAMNPEKPLGPRFVKQLDLSKLKADAVRGKELFADQCADCHGEDGLGTDDGPPVWGAQSYNDGAGLSNNRKLTSWLKVAMPLDDATLTKQEALDIAAFINDHDRPHFVIREHLPGADRMGEYNGNLPKTENPSDDDAQTKQKMTPVFGKWLIEDIAGRGVIDFAQTTIQIEKDGSVFGSTCVNRYRSAATIQGNKITFGPAATTRRAAAPAMMDQETKFLNALKQVASFHVDENGLVHFYDSDGNKMLRGSQMEN